MGVEGERMPETEARVTQLLVVDDELVQATMLVRLLERGGYRCTVATSVGEARSLLAREGFDLVLTDLRLGEADGLDLVRHIREDHPDTVAIVVTGLLDPDLEPAARAAGAFAVLEKPFDPHTMLGLVDEALRSRS